MPFRISTCLLALGICVLVDGCKQKTTDAKTELEKTADILAKGEPAQPAQPAAPEPAPAAPAPVEANIPDQPQAAATPTVSPAQQMRQALASYKTGELEDAVTRLQKLRAMSTLTSQQRMAVQDSVAAVMTEIYGLAAKGDGKAMAAVKQYEEMQTSHQ